MERADLVSGTTSLIGQSEKAVNFIRKKISDYMEPSHPALTVTGQLDKWANPLPYSCNPSKPAQ